MGANGTALLDFGAYPGVNEVTLDVTGQTGFVSTSNVEAYVQPKATADHSADEHRIEEIQVSAVYQADGTIRLYGRSTALGSRDGNGHCLYCKFNTGWVWV
jgi:hypothetical protein